MYKLEFPNLGIEFTMNPIAFSIGNFSIAWYGIIIAVGFLIALCYGIRNAKRVGVLPDKMIDVVIGGIIGGIIGARLYYVIFSWEMYKNNWLEIFEIWNGGLAIYGGIIGAVLAGWLICKWRKVKFTAMLDLAAPGFLIGQGIGRWGNFVNIEAYGANTNLPWGMWSTKILDDYLTLTSTPDDFLLYEPVHPCFLYESLWCIIGFFLIYFLVFKRRKFDGEVFLSYVAWYGLGRVFIEGLRTDSLLLGNLKVSQVLAGLLVVVAVAFIVVIRSKIARSGDEECLKLYVKTEAWEQELAKAEEEVRLAKERKERKKAGLPEEDPEVEYELDQEFEPEEFEVVGFEEELAPEDIDEEFEVKGFDEEFAPEELNEEFEVNELSDETEVDE